MTGLIVLATLAPVGLLAAGLYGLRRLADRWRRQPDRHENRHEIAAPIRLAGPGWLSEDERAAETWAAETTARDLERFGAALDKALHQFRAAHERALRKYMKDPELRAWYRVHTGEYQLVGVA